MPCGGIYPSKITPEEAAKPYCSCFFCGKYEPPPDHFMVEWDANVHGACVIKAIEEKNEEIAVVISHKHPIYLQLGEEE